MPQRLSRIQIIMIVVFLAAALYFGFRVLTNRSDGKLRASGTIEASEVDVSPETPGKVKQVMVEDLLAFDLAPASSGNPQRALEERDRRSFLRDGLDRLPPKLREAVERIGVWLAR